MEWGQIALHAYQKVHMYLFTNDEREAFISLGIFLKAI